jgi:short-subunit dehydrogenase
MALKLAHCQLKHLVLSGRNVEALEELKLACEKIDNCNQVHVLPCDLSDMESVIRFAKDALEKCENKVDMLLLNGGMSSRSSFLDTDIKVDELLMNVNFLSGAAISKEIVPSMVEKKNG